MTRTTYDVCQNPECGHMVTHPSRTVGRPFHDETEAPPVQIGGDFYAVEVQAPRPFHDEMQGERTYSMQDEMVPRGPNPVSFVSREDQEWADDPHYWGDGPPPGARTATGTTHPRRPR